MGINIGQTDKIIRIVIGLAIILAGIITQSWWGVIGVVPLLTSFIGFCPLYTVFRISTCPTTCGTEKPVKTGTPKH
jgi:hypothetical protein